MAKNPIKIGSRVRILNKDFIYKIGIVQQYNPYKYPPRYWITFPDSGREFIYVLYDYEVEPVGDEESDK